MLPPIKDSEHVTTLWSFTIKLKTSDSGQSTVGLIWQSLGITLKLNIGEQSRQSPTFTWLVERRKPGQQMEYWSSICRQS